MKELKHLALVAAAIVAATFAAQAQNKPYITKVYDFMPAPGQFVNELPEWEEGETKADVIARVESYICGYTKANGRIKIADGMISLGSYGGYVVFGFDHPVVNVKGENDFQVLGNAIASSSVSFEGGSSEPGIVMVSRDSNGNGLPDDPWFELAGSEHDNPRTQHNFEITYYRPAEHTAMPDPDNELDDTCYIAWRCNSIDSLTTGYVAHSSYHQQSYWPGWIEADSLTFRGTKLPCNATDEREPGADVAYWVQHFYDWGYVDNRPDYKYEYSTAALKDGMNTGFNIDWAVDADGNHVSLNKIDFVMVYCAVLQQCGRIGDTSTEVAGAFDLHPDAEAEPDPEVFGDVNGDKQVTVADVTEVYNVVLGASTTHEAQADVNSDSQVTVADVTAVYSVILGN